SRRRHTRCLSDWSSDVCSSDLSTTLARSSSVQSRWCVPEGAAKAADEVAQIVEPDGVARIGNARSGSQQRACPHQSCAHQVLMGWNARKIAEHARESERAHRDGPGEILQRMIA